MQVDGLKKIYFKKKYSLVLEECHAMLNAAINLLLENEICNYCRYKNNLQMCRYFSQNADNCRQFLYDGLLKHSK